MFRGTFTALVTPFREDAIDFNALQNLIESQIAAGIDGIIAVGTTGESPTLTHDERKEVIHCAIETANRRCLVLAGTGSYSTREAIATTEEAEKLGVDGALLVAPYYNKPSQEGLFRHFSAIAKSTPLRLMLYNIPGRCGVDIVAETVARIQSDCPNVVSIKEAGGNVDRVSELRTRLPDAFTVLSGDDGLTLPFLAAGAVGVVRSEEHTSELQSLAYLVCRLLLETSVDHPDLHSFPTRRSSDLVAETVARIQSDCPNVVSIKEAGGNVDRVSELRTRLPDAFTVLSGDDGLTLPFLAAGAVGVV